jgi:hypothetical protein
MRFGDRHAPLKIGRRKRLPHGRFRLPTVDTFGVFVTFGGRLAHGRSLAVAVRLRLEMVALG